MVGCLGPITLNQVGLELVMASPGTESVSEDKGTSYTLLELSSEVYQRSEEQISSTASAWTALAMWASSTTFAATAG
ncbi:hypothetical protein O181_010813 [Austropuccinia psidii MF-1]|uniref:Uncharacterized protein n=1 Tax=Austropuccinia psidii MF-1 TaxID=1389203 RepID=A0A9Q3GKR3_9BASI|nr:hypothetical protein [Austropuccinia psidii MF-1]